MKKKNMVSDRIVFLQGKRIYLRPPSKDDIPLFLRWINDPEVNQYLGGYLPMMEADEIEWLERIHKNKEKDMVFVLVDDKTNRPIGLMGLHGISWKDGTATTGAVIGEKLYWGKGCGTEAKMLLLNYAFNSLNLRKICSLVLSFNGRSQAYSQKCGYKVEGRLTKHIFKNGKFWDVIQMAIFKSDWLPKWETFQKTGKL
jgi:RimJ/RimL family protein N-acetyltransferase